MLIASSNASTSLAIPPTQNTAPVLEFNCLYTHDIRRKSKRWQDGVLRFHTFNKRVMVYDDTRNFVGDAHWRESDHLHDGDEVKLDKNGVLVQVADQIGQTETDLTDLRKSKKKPTANPASSSPLRLSTAITIVNPTFSDRRPLQAKHRPLNALLGADRAPIGKAVLPTKSPFEVRNENSRHVEADEWAQQGRAKRQRTVDTTVRDAGNGHKTVAQRANVAVTPLTDSRRANANTIARSHSSETRKTSVRKHSKEVVEIDLCSDEDHSEIFSSMLPERAAHTPSRLEMPPPLRTPTVQTSAETGTSGKRLSLAKTAPKKTMLACHSIASGETFFRDAQKSKLEARLAELQQRKAKHASGRTKQCLQPGQTTTTTEPNTASDEGALEAAIVAQHHDDDDFGAKLNAAGLVTASITDLDLAEDDLEALDAIMFDDDSESAAEPGTGNLDDTTSPVQERIEASHADNAGVVGALLVADEGDTSDEHDRPLRGDLHPEETSNAIAKEAPTGSAEELNVPLHLEPETDAAYGPSTEELADVPLHVESSVDAACDPPRWKTVNEDVIEASLQQTKLSELAAKQPFAPRRRKGVSRLEVRKSAVSCFRPPTPATRTDPSTTSKPVALKKLDNTRIASTTESGPWSREAFDLFAWRPPDWDEGLWSLKT